MSGGGNSGPGSLSFHHFFSLGRSVAPDRSLGELHVGATSPALTKRDGACSPLAMPLTLARVRRDRVLILGARHGKVIEDCEGALRRYSTRCIWRLCNCAHIRSAGQPYWCVEPVSVRPPSGCGGFLRYLVRSSRRRSWLVTGC